MRAIVVALLLGLSSLAHAQPVTTSPGELTAAAPRNDNGLHLDVKWANETPMGLTTVVLRHRAPDTARDGEAGTPPVPPVLTRTVKPGDALEGDWTVAYFGEADQSVVDEVGHEHRWIYVAFHARKTELPPGADGKPGERWELGPAVVSNPAAPVASFFNTDRWFYLVFIGLTGLAFALYLGYARRNAKDIFIRRIPGVDAIEDAIGRSTEMGRPILYVTGIEEIQDIQTIASLLILGHVAEMTAEYDSEIKVANTYPMTMVVAEEIVRQGYANAGRLDAHKPENVMFITSEQFAFAAAVNGMILRDRPATNIYFGRFFAESLLLAETGFLTGAVQIAGTAEFTQLPFFIAACDYTLLGEELYATSAYLSREPTLLAQLKAGDVVKAFAMILIVTGVVVSTVWGFDLGGWLMP